MLLVVKPGGTVVLYHHENEAERQEYEQLHQWNFTMEQGQFVIWNWKRRQVIDVNDTLSEIAEVTGSVSGNYLTVFMRKK
jgi:RecB family endonuclease NucS